MYERYERRVVTSQCHPSKVQIRGILSLRQNHAQMTPSERARAILDPSVPSCSSSLGRCRVCATRPSSQPISPARASWYRAESRAISVLISVQPSLLMANRVLPQRQRTRPSAWATTTRSRGCLCSYTTLSRWRHSSGLTPLRRFRTTVTSDATPLMPRTFAIVKEGKEGAFSRPSEGSGHFYPTLVMQWLAHPG